MQPRNSYLHRYPVWTILIATSVFAAPPTGHPPAVEPAVGAIAFGDQHVTAAEQQLVMRLHVAEIFQHYRRTAGSIDDRVFWDTPIGDERPIDRLRTLTLDDLRAAYAEAAVARKHGVLVPRFEHVIQPANSSPDHRGPVAGVGARVQDPTTLYLAARRRVQADVCRVIAAELSADETALKAEYERSRARYRNAISGEVLPYETVRASVLAAYAHEKFRRQCTTAAATLAIDPAAIAELYPLTE